SEPEDEIAKHLESFGIENPFLEARWILEKYQDEHAIHDLLARRAKGEPLAYLLEEKGFYEDIFYVKPGVLIPRPETELLVECSLKFFGQNSFERPLIYDFGCGSGCIGLS